MTLKGSGESFAQIAAEKANPKLDVWFGGTGDPHLQAAEQGLLEEYKSPMLAQLQPWAQKQAEQSKYRTVGMYLGVLGIGYNTELLAKKKLAAPACWKDLVKPEFAGEVQMANPNASGTAYTAIATLVQVFGEEEAFKYLKALHKNINNYPRSGVGADQGGRARRDARQRVVHPRRRHRGAGRLSGEGRRALRGHRLRDRLDVDRQGRAQPRQREEILRLGVDAEGAGARRAQAKQFQIPSNVERAGLAAVAEDSPTSSSSTTTSRSTARRPSASGCSSAGTRKSAPSPSDRRSDAQLRQRLDSHELAHVPPFLLALRCLVAALAARSSTCTAARPTPPGARAWRSASRRRPASRSPSMQKATGEMLAQIKAERANPKGDIWWAGAGRHLPAGGRGRPARDVPLAQRRRSSTTGRSASPRSRRTASPASTAASSRSATTPRCRRRRSCRCRNAGRTCSIPRYKGEVMLGNPNSSGTAYLMLASLVQVFGEDEAFKYMKALNAQREPATRAPASAR